MLMISFSGIELCKAFKASPFDGRFFDIESPAEITEPAGDNDVTWSVLLETVSREKGISSTGICCSKYQ